MTADAQLLAQAVVDNADRLGLLVKLTFATVVDGTTPSATTVELDSDAVTPTPIPTISLIGAKVAGDRVAVLSMPGGGQYIIGFPS